MSALWRWYYTIYVAVGVCSVEIVLYNICRVGVCSVEMVLYNGGSSMCLLCGDGIIQWG